MERQQILKFSWLSIAVGLRRSFWRALIAGDHATLKTLHDPLESAEKHLSVDDAVAYWHWVRADLAGDLAPVAGVA